MSQPVENAREVIVNILAEWHKSDQKIDTVRDSFLTNKSTLDERDRGLVTEVTYGVVRNITAIDEELNELVTADLEKMQHRLLAILRSGLYQIRFLDRIPNHAAANEAVNLSKKMYGIKASGLVNAVMRKAAGKKMETKRAVDAFYVEGSHLNIWRTKWLEKFGEEKTDELIHHFEKIPPFALRRNLLKTSSDKEWHEILKKEGVEFDLIEGWPGYVYTTRTNPANLPSFQQGITTVQDPAAGLAVHALNPQPGENILDLCCAPGGKTAHIWERMNGEGSLTAVDKNMKRNHLTREGLQRLGHEGVNVLSDDVMKMDFGSYDRVLIDVPCSGTGVAHRRADLLMKRHPLKVLKLGQMQRSLLEHASKMVKVGGVLVYSTCSLENEENSKRRAGFNKKYPGEFKMEELPAGIPENWILQEGEAATWPPRDSVDGAYVVRWRRLK